MTGAINQTGELVVGLSAVIVAADPKSPFALVTRHGKAGSGLPFGPFNPSGHRTFELGLRDWVTAQTGFELGYVEQLYTFGDRGRELPKAEFPDAPENARLISVGYLGIAPEITEIDGAFDAVWRDWYRYFPWEDHRNGIPKIIENDISPALRDWATGNSSRLERARQAFGLDGSPWVEERVIDRYELLYEIGLVYEACRDSNSRCDSSEQRFPDLGDRMVSDHRRILATAISRLRGKLKYRPVVFEFTPEKFTLFELQLIVESILGLPIHKQNFRRSLEKSQLVQGLQEYSTGTGGRPAELFRFCREHVQKRAVTGISTPVLRRD